MKANYGWVIVGVGIVVTCVGVGAMLALTVFLAPMAEALSHRNGDEALCALIDRHARRTVVMAASSTDPELGISAALDGAIVNAAELVASIPR